MKIMSIPTSVPITQTAAPGSCPLMIGGLFRIVTPIVMHLPHRGWLLLSGVVTLLLGVYI
jgi:hypothetical protein